MIVSTSLSIAVGDTTMSAYLARPGDGGTFPAVIVLEGVYGFDSELKRVTDSLPASGSWRSRSTISTARIRI
jgi:dienelactone hydrolase